MNKLSEAVFALRSRLNAALKRIEELEYGERLVQNTEVHLYDLRKCQQDISLRSFTSLEELCSGMSMLASIRQKSGANVFLECAELFNS